MKLKTIKFISFILALLYIAIGCSDDVGGRGGPEPYGTQGRGQPGFLCHPV